MMQLTNVTGATPHGWGGGAGGGLPPPIIRQSGIDEIIDIKRGCKTKEREKKRNVEMKERREWERKQNDKRERNGGTIHSETALKSA